MPNFYCEYCGIYLKHSSPFGRKQHSRGKKHIYNKVEYYSQFLIEFQQQHECNPIYHSFTYREQTDAAIAAATERAEGTSPSSRRTPEIHGASRHDASSHGAANAEATSSQWRWHDAPWHGTAI